MNRYRTRLDRLESALAPSDLDDILAFYANDQGLTDRDIEAVRANVLADLRKYHGMNTREVIAAKASELGCSANELMEEAHRLQEAYRS